jgi:rare lipoprotein A
VASWYGTKRFNGRLTANGEIFDDRWLTVASPDIRFGTIVQITNPSNGKTIVARVNDRGPYWPGRNLDVSKRCAERLGFIKKGVTKLRLSVLFRPERAMTAYHFRPEPMLHSHTKFGHVQMAQTRAPSRQSKLISNVVVAAKYADSRPVSNYSQHELPQAGSSDLQELDKIIYGERGSPTFNGVL